MPQTFYWDYPLHQLQWSSCALEGLKAFWGMIPPLKWIAQLAWKLALPCGRGNGAAPEWQFSFSAVFPLSIGGCARLWVVRISLMAGRIKWWGMRLGRQVGKSWMVILAGGPTRELEARKKEMRRGLVRRGLQAAEGRSKWTLPGIDQDQGRWCQLPSGLRFSPEETILKAVHEDQPPRHQGWGVHKNFRDCGSNPTQLSSITAAAMERWRKGKNIPFTLRSPLWLLPHHTPNVTPAPVLENWIGLGPVCGQKLWFKFVILQRKSVLWEQPYKWLPPPYRQSKPDQKPVEDNAKHHIFFNKLCECVLLFSPSEKR